LNWYSLVTGGWGTSESTPSSRVAGCPIKKRRIPDEDAAAAGAGGFGNKQAPAESNAIPVGWVKAVREASWFAAGGL